MKKSEIAVKALLIGLLCFPLLCQAITVSSPAAGASWPLESTQTINWSRDGFSGDVRIALYQNGSPVGIIQNGLPAASGSYSWTVGELLSGAAGVGGNYRIRVVGIRSDEMGQSANFSIAPAAAPEPEPEPEPARPSHPILVLKKPLGDRVYVLGEHQQIEWAYKDIPSTMRFKVELYRGISNPVTQVGVIASNIPYNSSNTSSIEWQNGAYSGGRAAAGKACYFIKVSTMGNQISAANNKAFSLINPVSDNPAPTEPEPEETAQAEGSITIASPLAPLTITHQFAIGWNARNIEGNLVINLLGESGGTYTLATGVDPGLAYGRYNWTVGRLANPSARFPNVRDTRFRFQIGGRGTDGRGVVALSRWFEIIQPEIIISEPHNGERLRRGNTKTIRWNAPELRGNVHIEAYCISTTPGSFYSMYERIFSNTSNDGHQDWRIWPRPRVGNAEINPPPTGDSYRWAIRLISATCPWIFVQVEQFIIE
jgi:hypothetical protein